MDNKYKILSLDGGGAKGFYTLGVLKEIESMVAKPLHECFDLIFGTSTGAIIASLIALGHNIDDIHQMYKDHVPAIMSKRTPNKRSETLAKLADEIFGKKSFQDVKTGVGVVATKWIIERPMLALMRTVPKVIMVGLSVADNGAG